VDYIQIEFRFPVTGMTIYLTFSNISDPPIAANAIKCQLWRGYSFYTGRWNSYRNSALNSPVDAVYPDRVSFSCNADDYSTFSNISDPPISGNAIKCQLWEAVASIAAGGTHIGIVY
jgi:hypothetical protein